MISLKSIRVLTTWCESKIDSNETIIKSRL